MQRAANGAESFQGHTDNFGVIVSDLISLVEHVQASIDLIERAIAREMTTGDPDSSNVIVLDDVTPHYIKASTALSSCSANIGSAMQFLLDGGAYARTPLPVAGG